MIETTPLVTLGISLVAFIRLIVWCFKGAGHRKTRVVITAAYLLLQVYSWLMVTVFGALHQTSLWALGLCLVIAVFAFFIPAIHKRLIDKR